MKILLVLVGIGLGEDEGLHESGHVLPPYYRRMLQLHVCLSLGG